MATIFLHCCCGWAPWFICRIATFGPDLCPDFSFVFSFSREKRVVAASFFLLPGYSSGLKQESVLVLELGESWAAGLRMGAFFVSPNRDLRSEPLPRRLVVVVVVCFSRKKMGFEAKVVLGGGVVLQESWAVRVLGRTFFRGSVCFVAAGGSDITINRCTGSKVAPWRTA